MNTSDLIKEARRRDRDVLGKPGILTQLADALEGAQAALNFKQGIIEDLSAEIHYLTTGEEPG